MSGGPDSCWNWKLSTSRDGYGQVSKDSIMMSAHRVAFLLHNGYLPPRVRGNKQIVMHTCDNKICCNPAHLKEGTSSENNIDAYRRGLKVGFSPNSLKTHCDHGHPFNEENTYITKDGSRMCKVCRRDRMRKYYRA